MCVAGEWRREDGLPPEIVAVKVLKDSASREAEEDFMREVDIMSAFRHTNILSLIGVVLRGEAHMSKLMPASGFSSFHTHYTTLILVISYILTSPLQCGPQKKKTSSNLPLSAVKQGPQVERATI